jgi:hypothetical protein
MLSIKEFLIILTWNLVIMPAFSGSTVLLGFFSFSPNMRYFSKMLHLGIVFSSLTLVSVHGAWTRYRLVNGVFSYPNCSKGNFSQSTLTSKR